MPRYYDDWVEACAEAASDSPIPRRFRWWAALSAVSGALGRRSWYEQGAYRVWPNLFIVLVGDPTSGKSLSFILPYDVCFRRICAPVRGTEVERKAAESDWRRYMGDEIGVLPLHMVKDSITHEQLSHACGHITAVVTDISGMDTLRDKDYGTLFDSSLSVIVDEFGTFMDQYDRRLQTLLTSGWDGKIKQERHLKTEKQKGDDIKGFCINWLAGATQSQFAENLPANAAEQGLLSRIIVVYYHGKAAPRRVTNELVDQTTVERLRADLGDISRLRGPFILADGLADHIQGWLDEGEAPKPTDPMMQEYAGRRFSHLLKMSMAICAARRTNMVIKKQDWDTATRALFEVERDMPAILLRFGMSPTGKVALDLCRFVERAGGRVGASQLKREAIRLCRGAAEVEQLIGLMLDAQMLELEGGVYVL